MIIQIKHLKDGVPVSVSHSYEAKELDVEYDDLKYTSKINLHGTISRDDKTLSFSGTMFGEVVRTCGRCLTSDEEEFTKPFSFFYDINNEATIDATENLREELILDHPMVYICKAGCMITDETDGKKKGLELGAKDALKGQPFASLKKMIQEKKEGKKNGTSET